MIAQKITFFRKTLKRTYEKSFCVIEILSIFCLVNVKRAIRSGGQKRDFLLWKIIYYFSNYLNGLLSSKNLPAYLCSWKLLANFMWETLLEAQIFCRLSSKFMLPSVPIPIFPTIFFCMNENDTLALWKNSFPVKVRNQNNNIEHTKTSYTTKITLMNEW